MPEADDRFAAEGVAKLVHGILKLGVIDYNIERGTMRRNRHMYEMFDVPWELRDQVESPEDFILRIHPADAGKISATWGGCVAGENGGSFCQTYRIITNNGTTTVITHGETMLNTDGTSSIVAIVQDITEVCRMKQEEAEQEAATAQLNATLSAELKHKEDMHRLLRTISHEVRNPLHGILANTQALLDMLRLAEEQAAEVTRRLAGASTAAVAAALDDASVCDSSSLLEWSSSEHATSSSGSSTGTSTDAVTDVAADTSSDDSADVAAYSTAAKTATAADAAAADTAGTCTSAEASTAAASALLLDCAEHDAAATAAVYSYDCSPSSSDHTGDAATTAVANSSSVSSDDSSSNRHQQQQQQQQLTTGSHRRLSAAQAWADAPPCSSSSSAAQLQQQAAADRSSELASMKGMVAEIHECALHQASIINDLLDFEMLKGGSTALKVTGFDVDEAVRGVVRMFNTSARIKGLSLLHEMPLQHRIAQGDVQSIKRILMNLISNALKFTDEGSITVNVEQESQDGMIAISVADTGVGIPAEFRDKLFHTIGLTTTNEEFLGGSGLGLCICKTLAEKMGGTVGFVDNAPHGTVMTLRLPAVQQSCGVTVTSEATSEATSGQTSAADAALPAGAAAAAAAAESACDYADMLRDKRILVAEDNRINQKVLRMMLQANCAELTIVSDGQQAVEAFSKPAVPAYDVLILDVHMPKMGGREAAAIIRQHNKHTPIIFLTGEIAGSMQGSTKELAPAHLLLKPCTKSALVATCGRLLKDACAQASEQ